MRVLVRADASLRIGSGHVMRCLTLAEALRQAGCDVQFACRPGLGDGLALIAARGFPVHRLEGVEDERACVESPLPWAEDLAALWQALPAGTTFDWCVVDHYGLGAEWERGVRLRARWVMAIDDLLHRPHEVDLLLDQNATARQRLDDDSLATVRQPLLGPHFALLREAFQGAPIAVAERVERVLVSFGGVDIGGETLKALAALETFPDVAVDVVAGAANPAWGELEQRVSQHPRWTLHRHVDDFAGLMRQADLCIGAGGGTTWERAALGLPTLCVALAPNQRPNAERLAEAGLHLYLGEAADLAVDDYRAALRILLGNPGLRRSLAARGRETVDGRGVRRVVAALLARDLRMRAATLDDAQLLFEGRNAEPVRRASLNTEPVEWSSHVRWLERVLASPDQHLLWLAEAADGPVGVLRYDRIETARVEVSLYLLPGRDSAGWGLYMLQAGEAALALHWPEVSGVEARVRPDNLASLLLFERAGFTQRHCVFQRTLQGESR
ncbi:UDP-2,4-diacetamido-2,4,6-trideoxy-beta-L-altropyranose hydrolase [Metapseudomonas otitidis]|uniref:UDP-2,4-diacetamido-2,4, 6-trideoxy-beta-L-altropyranose hydrolase n=1 Tax=Metapseudomonas otitidis TaxID=319939 RepID=UPI0008F2EB8B|nr:UDP-2,4-diacetamido-2,4,6-trideoxy-beta-L-altropyranose hydrolase [Pseudomonas otitidis]SFA47098.1 UDP-2,4-diacetamido-2,4,6-trideoxy-beta-L-altropyranose hydrolase [Pseudomonas otitidis]